METSAQQAFAAERLKNNLDQQEAIDPKILRKANFTYGFNVLDYSTTNQLNNAMSDTNILMCSSAEMGKKM